METKVIACDQRIKMIKHVAVDMFLECKGLLSTIYHHAKEYDNCLIAREEDSAKAHLESFNILGRIFNATIEENFTLKDKMSLIGQAQSLCLRMLQETKDERIRGMCRKLLTMYNRTMIRIVKEHLDEKNSPK